MPLDPAKLLAWPIPEIRQQYTAKDTILYALGLGCGADPVNAHELRHVYEEHLVALPSMATVLGYPGFWLRDPGTGVDWTRVVHAGQTVELLRPLAAEGHVIGRSRVTAVEDKGPGRGALVTSERDLVGAESGEAIARLTHTAFLRGQGGFGGPPGTSKPLPPMPDTPPDATIDIPTLPQAALIYRLSGDWNPLHADPAVATAAGFPRPILHGLCTFGVATRAVLQARDDDPASLRLISARFAAPVLPGEMIRTEIWHHGGRTRFRSSTRERGVVLDQGEAVGWGALPHPTEQVKDWVRHG